ncbi:MULTISPECIES: DUF4148 domain-containing protein [Caballeronia]|jgi:hypothetical protein|uniref:DUF4148 domain-containing protein n=1 Tax=Caballeronia zhejiangensis TaxID=871203 RepID=A0A656QVE7_9BURK|nr:MULTISPECIES: DUF4148 domain-containing protein [Caballeronia]EKS71125.1 hypothetical protein BURK_014443 [Burkholderia sp. SJ98]KDR34147.1 hypothetical protein BG60_03065 [Caballeronia zhejiangensis]MDR5788351.1 DUF4148 domain-containing protein [Caballeronia sp. LP003]
MKTLSMIPALAIALAGCAAGGSQPGAPNLSAAQCRDLTALRNHAPLTRERNLSELAALERAGYVPSKFFDPYYPDDLHAAQRQVDIWYRTECPEARTN